MQHQHLKQRKMSLSREEKHKLNQFGRRILNEAGLNFEEGKDYDWLIKCRYVGYAHFYLYGCGKFSEASMYRRLVAIDSKLGTKASLQLYLCLSLTTRWDIIKVRIFDCHLDLQFISYKLIQNIDFEQVTDNEEVTKRNAEGAFIGYAEQYLDRCNIESKSDKIKDVRVYSKLVELDAKLGTMTAEQLFYCLLYTLRWDIIKV